MKALSYWIKERINPQFGTYYVPCGQLTKRKANRCENALYGDNIMHPFKTEDEYRARIEELRKMGESVTP